MGLVTPNSGTIFWLIIIFGIVIFILGKYAWKPILNVLKEREESIRDALRSADLARNQLENLKNEQDLMRVSALEEREQILKDARVIKERIIAEAREKATRDSEKLLAQVHEQIENEKNIALNDLKQQVAEFSVRIAETILKEKLESTPRQEKIIRTQLEEFKLN
jgi:F-type H+-transporting ATPase subunit b